MTAPRPRRSVGRIDLSGRYLAWIESSFRARDSLVVHDLETDREVLRLGGRDLGGRFISDVALEADGTAVVTFGGNATRAVWAVQSKRRGEGEPRGPGRIIVRRL